MRFFSLSLSISSCKQIKGRASSIPPEKKKTPQVSLFRVLRNKHYMASGRPSIHPSMHPCINVSMIGIIGQLYAGTPWWHTYERETKKTHKGYQECLYPNAMHGSSRIPRDEARRGEAKQEEEEKKEADEKTIGRNGAKRTSPCLHKPAAAGAEHPILHLHRNSPAGG